MMYNSVNRDEGSTVCSAVAKVPFGWPNKQFERVQRDSERFHGQELYVWRKK